MNPKPVVVGINSHGEQERYHADDMRMARRMVQNLVVRGLLNVHIENTTVKPVRKDTP